MPLATYASDGSAKVLLQPYVDSVVTPTLVYPTSDGMYVSALPDIDWTDTGTTYDLIISVNSDLSAPIVNLNSITALAVSHYLTSGLVLNTTYYYRFRAHYRFGTSAWSATRTFVYSDALITYISAKANLVGFWPLDDTSGALARVINPAVAVGRTLLLDGDMEEVGVTRWSASAGTPTKETGSPHGGTQTLRLTNTGTNGLVYQNVAVPGYLHHFVGYIKGDGTLVSMRVTGSATVYKTVMLSGAYQLVDFYFMATGTQLFGFQAVTAVNGLWFEVDDVSLTVVDIKASSTYPTTERFRYNFAYDSGSPGTNWAITGSKLVHTAGSTTNAAYAGVPTVVGKSYDVTYRVTGRTAGDVTVKVGTTGAGATRSTNNTFTESIVCAGTAGLYFTPASAFDGSIDLVSVVPTDGLIVYNGDFELGTTAGWTAGNSATLSIETATPPVGGGTYYIKVLYGGVSNPNATQVCLDNGVRYRITGKMRGDGSGALPRIVENATLVLAGLTTASWQDIDIDFVASGGSLRLQCATGTVGRFALFDNIVITQIAPMTGVVSGALINQAGTTLVPKLYSFDGTNDFVNLYSLILNSAFNPSEGTLSILIQMANAGVWTDGILRRLLAFSSDANDRILIDKAAASNTLAASYIANGTNKGVSTTLSLTTLFMVTITWSKSGDQVIVYINGAQVGSIQTGLGTWVGNFAATTCLIGSGTTSGTNPHSGFMALPNLRNTALSAALVLAEAQLAGVAS